MSVTNTRSSRRSSGKKSGLLETGLAQFGSRGNGALAQTLSHPLADYYIILFTTILLVGVGVLMVLSSSSVWSQVSQDGDLYYYLGRQVLFLLMGIPVAWVLSRRGATSLSVMGWIGMIVSIVLLILVLTPLGTEENGNRAWIKIGDFGTIQPSEFAKASLILWSAAVLANRSKTLSDPRRLLFPFLLGYGLVLGLVLLEHDLGTAIIIGLIMFAMLWFVGAPFRVIFSLGALSLSLVALEVVFSAERRRRIMGFWTGDLGSSDQPMNAIYGLASGGWLGVGLGRSRQKWGGLYSGAQTDYVFAVLGEEMGLLGTLSVLALFTILTFAGLRAAARSSSPFLRYAAVGMTAWIILQALVNIMVVMRMLPVVGVPLPFISQGGSALLANLIAVGVLLAVARQEPAAAKLLQADRQAKKPKLTSVLDGPRVRPG